MKIIILFIYFKSRRTLWKSYLKLFAGSAEKFVEEYGEKYPKLKEFFQSDKFPKFMPHIKDFCIEYAADSGKVPHC